MIKEIALPFDLELPPSRILKAGVLTCLYDAGNLRYISLDKTELVRKVYAAVRNSQWTTIPCKIQDEIITIKETGFLITYTAVYSLEKELYKTDFIIEGKPDNTITFSIHGLALADFKRNRIGLCLHHPLKESIGRTVTVTSPDGTSYQSSFPEFVSPTLPFLEMSKLEWTTENGITVDLNFEGDVFETEDQRNWSDGSFKSYSTRSSLPRPVDVKTGDTIEQKITIKISGAPKTAAEKTTPEPREIKVPFPQIGYMRSPGVQAFDVSLIDWLVKIPFDHYRVTMVLHQHVWRRILRESLSEASLINTRLELVVFFSDDYKNEVVDLVKEIHEKQLLVGSILVLQTHHNISPAGPYEYLYPVLKSALPAVKVGYGTDELFVDVNENRPGNLPFDFISFGLHPQAHAFDNRSILENLQSQPYIMKTAVNISGGQPVYISPVTLKDKKAGADARLHSSMMAMWALLALQNFSEAYSITFYELLGDKGILQAAKQEDDLTVIINPSPVYEVLATIFAFQPTWVIKRFEGSELLMDGLLMENEQGEQLFFKAPDEYTVLTR